MHSKYSRISIAILILISSLAASGSVPYAQSTGPRILLFGDSWAGLMWLQGAYQDVFDQYGYPDVLVDGSLTKSGGRADDWAKAAGMKLVFDKLQDSPSIDMVIISLGGNDLLGTWHTGMTATKEEKLLKAVKADQEAIVKLVLEIRPDIEILLAGYDYGNFVDSVLLDGTGAAQATWEDLGSPTPAIANSMLVRLEQNKVEIANSYERVYYVQALGLMQYVFGYPDSPKELGPGFRPHSVPFPGQNPPNYAPFPGGDVNYPSPPTAMYGFGRDPVHLNEAGYRALAANQMQYYFLPKLRGTPALTITSQFSGRSGWVRSDGTVGEDFIIMGDERNNLDYRGLLSFDTSAIPTNADITRATIYLTRISSCCGDNPFVSAALGPARVDVITGSFNLPEIEPSDYAASAHAQDAGDFFGSVSEVGYILRIELNAAGIAAINTKGLTQLRLQFSDSDAGADWIGFDNGELADASPILEVYYDSATFSPLDLFAPALQNGDLTALALLFFLCLIGISLGGIGLISLIIVRWQRSAEHTDQQHSD